MELPFPYTYYSCDCYNTKSSAPAKRPSQQQPATDEEERTFDPRNPRSNYSLYPLEHLLYCEDCQQIRCPRCVIEETLNWFCPSCLFEVPSSMIKSEGNRCTRNCYNCPICTSPMTVSSLEPPRAPADENLGPAGPFFLACPYCHWSTLDIGIEFEKHTGITQQLSRIANGGGALPTLKEREKERDRRKEEEAQGTAEDDSPTAEPSEPTGPPTHDELFSNLSAFYKSQIQATMPSNPFSPHDISFSSPSSFSRIMSLYSSSTSKKQKREKPTPMREAASQLEGLNLHNPSNDAAAIARIKKEGWSSTASLAQKLLQPSPDLRFTSELRPLATILRTKRGKRCRDCRHILSKPESKITSTRYKIKLLALNHIPRLTLRALNPASTPSLSSSQGPGSARPISTIAAATPVNYDTLRPGIPTHFLLTLHNPLFDTIRVTLATSSTTPGKVASRVTILCPQFDVGANTDVWDDALTSTSSGTGASGIEAGKIWDKGRNWTTIVLEVVPGFLKPVVMPGQERKDGEEEELGEDEDVLEIPVFVRLEFEADVGAEGDTKGAREKREEAFWVVLGVGRIVG